MSAAAAARAFARDERSPGRATAGQFGTGEEEWVQGAGAAASAPPAAGTGRAAAARTHTSRHPCVRSLPADLLEFIRAGDPPVFFGFGPGSMSNIGAQPFQKSSPSL